MAKNTKITRRRKTQPMRRPRRKIEKSGDDLDSHALGAAKMYVDPCGADLVPSVYPGDRGYINRFTSVLNVANGALETAGVWIAKPGVNVGYNGAAASGGTALAVSYVDTQMPGAAFLNAQATKARCVGYCSAIRVGATINSATGYIYYGIVPASTFASGSFSIDTIVASLTHSVSASSAAVNPIEICWSPGAFDDRYCPPTGLTADDDSDRNILVVAANGLPAATGFNVRNTAIYEWTPASVAIDSTSVTPSKCDFNCVLRNLKRKDPEWWFRQGQRGVSAVASILGAYGTGGVGGAMKRLGTFL